VASLKSLLPSHCYICLQWYHTIVVWNSAFFGSVALLVLLFIYLFCIIWMCIFITFALKMRKVMFWSPCIYLYACYSYNSKSIKPNRMKFGGMIGYYPGTIWIYFGIDWFKGQGQGHEKVNIFFELHDIWWDDWLLSGDHLIIFWDWLVQRSRSRSWKGQHILWIAWNLVGWLVIIRGPFD